MSAIYAGGVRIFMISWLGDRTAYKAGIKNGYGTMRAFFGAIAIISLASGLNAQDNYSTSALGLSPNTIQSIQVRVADNADGACWTNLKEVREYAEEKLRIEGYNVVAELQYPMPPDFWFWIGIGGTRDQIDTCDGVISISVQSMVRVGAFGGRFVLAPEVNRAISSAGENLNRRVLQAVQEMIDHM